MRKLFAVPALACAALSVLAVGALAKPAPTPTKPTINAYAEGVFSHLTGPKKSCRANRKVVVYRQLGDKPDPASAVAPATKGCAAARTGSVVGISVAAAAGPSGIPVCSPYTAEGPRESCSLQRPGVEWGISYDFPSRGVRACELSKSDYSCDGNAGGPFPFGDASSGGRNSVTMSWRPGTDGFKAVSVVTGGGSGYGSSRMDARLPGPGSAELYVDKWTVVTDSGATTEFFTPDLPGQKAGEPGGPLYLDFEGDKGAFGLGAEVHIKGFLYVKR